MGKHQPALLGGLLIGVLSSLPVVSVVNVCCCLWVVLGGGFVVYLQQQRTPGPVETADAVLGGLIAGLIGATISVIATTAMASMGGALMGDQFQAILDQNPDIPPEARDFFLNLASGQGVFLVMFAVTLPIYAVFSMLGSLLGLAIFRKKTPPPTEQSA
jgi:hypothetical protein